VRDHGYDLPKKVRALGLKTALSSKQADGKLVVLDAPQADRGEDQGAGGKRGKLGWARRW
jgi:large subunit ribosomal protein L4